MCEFFSCIVTKDLRVLFCEMDSHEDIIIRASLKDDQLQDRNFVRLEIPEGKMQNFKVDEVGTLPDWYINEEMEIKRKCEELVEQVKPLRDAYNAQVKPLRDAYDAQVKPLWDAHNTQVKLLWDAYDAQLKLLRDAYDAQLKLLRNAYNAQVKLLRDACDAQVKPLRDAYNTQVKPLRDAYDAQLKLLRDAYLPKLAKIDGYVWIEK